MKLNIFGKTVPILFANIRKDGFDGLFDPFNWTITIDDKNHDKFSTIIHEMVHSIHYRVGITQTKINQDTQEILAETLAIAIKENFETLAQAYVIDNPKIKIKYK
jgi:hypothetical protein